METLLNKASAITASDEVTEYDDLADFGLDDPANTVTLKTDSGLTTIYIGSQNAITNEYYLKTGDSDTIYVVDSAPATGFDKSVEDLTAKQMIRKLRQKSHRRPWMKRRQRPWCRMKQRPL